MKFNDDFIWGGATASYQIEGGAYEDGRGLSIWDDFSHNSGKTFRSHNGDIACDHYHRVKEDVELISKLGIKNYRFSVSWTRLLPNGIGRFNQKGIDFYNCLIDELLDKGITPWLTLFHWDYPLALHIRGGWENPESVSWFSDYSNLIAKSFGDRVKKYFTMNEPQCFIGLGYRKGIHAPGYCLPNSALVPMVHHVLTAQGESVEILRSSIPECKIGYVTCADAAVPYSLLPEDIEAAKKAYFAVDDHKEWPMSVSWWNDPVVFGRYPEDGMRFLEKYLPDNWDLDMAKISRPIDYLCQNIYQGRIIKAEDNFRGWTELDPYRGSSKTACQWDINPKALYWGPKFLYDKYKLPIIITENGMSAHDVISLDGKVHDPNRTDYIHRYLLEYRKAAMDGVDAAGYFVWSIFDNFEWNSGYSERFGLVFVDYENDCHRIIKDSASWYKEVMESNGESL